MNDTPDHMDKLVSARYAAMTPAERIAIVVAMRQSARDIVESSLPPGLTRERRRYAVAKRFYGDELPEAALMAHSTFQDEA
ncbi:MAG: hypothetical protein RL030_826 [Pseudomonadota bacterium]|jgi:hypothetical protein